MALSNQLALGSRVQFAGFLAVYGTAVDLREECLSGKSLDVSRKDMAGTVTKEHLDRFKIGVVTCIW